MMQSSAVDSMRSSLACSVAPPRCIALAPTLCSITDVNVQSIVGLLWSVLCSTDELHRELAEPHGASALARLPQHCRFHESSATKASPDARAYRDVQLPSFNRAALARHASQHLGVVTTCLLEEDRLYVHLLAAGFQVHRELDPLG